MQYAQRVLSFLLLALFLSTSAFAETTASRQAFAQWITEQSSEAVSGQTASAIVEQTYINAIKHNIDPLLILSIIKAESGFRPKITNRYGASGLMQVVPKYHKDKIAGRNILLIKTNIEVGVKILQDCFVASNDNFYKAMRCYSGGASAKYVQKIQKTHQRLRNVDIETRFAKELPVTRQASWGKPRFLQPAPLTVAVNALPGG